MMDCYCFSTISYALEIKGVNLPEELTIKNTKCYLNGAGIRKKFFFSIYVIGLYLPEKMNDAEKIINLNKNKAVLMVFTYHKISSKKIKKAWTEGFEKYQDYIENHNFNECKTKGVAKMVDKDYIVNPNEVIEIRFNI